jgi:protoheme IX farnesyltransferase
MAAGRVSPTFGLFVGVSLSLASVPLMFAANAWVALLGLVALFTYVALYTPMKRTTSWSLPVGAIAGAMPPAMGYVAATGQLDGRAGYLFALLFMWQLPHFMAISIVRADEYRAAGLAVGARAGGAKLAMVASSVVLLATTLAAPYFGLGLRWAWAVSLVAGLAMVALAVRAARPGAGRSEARDAFAFTMAHLALVLTTLGVDRLPQ